MTEKHFILEEADPIIFYGVNNTNMQMIKALHPKMRIVARGNVVKVMGDEEELCTFEENIEKLQRHCAKYNSLSEEDIIHIVRGERTKRDGIAGAIVFSVTGKPITARSENQQRLVEAFDKHDMRAMKNKEVRRIILSRPAVEAGEKLGFLPGDMKEKIDPYLQPLYDALEDMIPRQKLNEMMEQNIIQIAPLAFMRGRTLNDAVVILDEAQNTTPAQIKMFLTRMGMNTKMVITGDMTQIDLPHSQKSGLIEALKILEDIDEIAVIHLNEKDIVRHKLVTKIVEAYERKEKALPLPLPYRAGSKDRQDYI